MNFLKDLRARLLLLVLAAVIPAFIVVGHTAIKQREQAIITAEHDALGWVRLATLEQSRLVVGTRQLLLSLSKLPEVRRATLRQGLGECARTLADVRRPHPYYANFGVATADGNFVCSAVPLPGRINVADRPYFRRTVESREFGIGDYQIGRVVHRSTLNFGHAILDRLGKVQGVVFAAMELAWLNQLIVQEDLPTGAELLVLDSKGVVLARWPDSDKWLGKSIEQSPLATTILTRDGQGTAELPGPDGVVRLYAFAPLHNNPQGKVYVGVGFPKALALAAANETLIRNVTVLLIAAVIALILAWIVGDVMVLRPVRRISHTLARAAEHPAPVQVAATGPAEIATMAGAFNRLMALLEERDQRLHNHQQLLESEVERRTHEANQAREMAEEANRKKSKFLAGASHDLRQPLHAIGILVGALRERIKFSDVRVLVDKIETSVEALDDLFNALLDISKLDAHVVVPRSIDFRIEAILHNVDLHYRPAAEQKGLAFRIMRTRALVHSDPVLLDRIVRNLVANAVQYTSQGKIVIGCRRRGTMLEIQVGDTGGGIPDDKHQEIFGEFVQLGDNGRDRSKGLGLGLSIVQRLAELMGHSIDIRSIVDRGSMFSVRVPMAKDASVHLDVDRTDPAAATLAGTFIIVIDDEDGVVFGMHALLTALGCRVIGARSGDDAIRQLNEHERSPDLIVCDYRINNRDNGIEVIRKIRQTQALPIPAVIITGSHAPEDLDALMASGYPVIHKPISDKRLCAALSAILTQHTACAEPVSFREDEINKSEIS